MVNKMEVRVVRLNDPDQAVCMDSKGTIFFYLPKTQRAVTEVLDIRVTAEQKIEHCLTWLERSPDDMELMERLARVLAEELWPRLCLQAEKGGIDSILDRFEVLFKAHPAYQRSLNQVRYKGSFYHGKAWDQAEKERRGQPYLEDQPPIDSGYIYWADLWQFEILPDLRERSK